MATRETPPAGLSLERRLPLLISILLLVVVVVFAGAAYREARRSAEIAAQQRVRSAAAQLAGIAAPAWSGRAATLRALASSGAVVAALRPGAAAAPARDLLARSPATADSAFDAWVLVDRSGAHRLTVGAPASAEDSAKLAQLVAAAPDSARTGPLYQAGDRIFNWSYAPVHVGDERLGVLAQRRHLLRTPDVGVRLQALIGPDVTLHYANIDGSLWTGPGGTILQPPIRGPLPLDTLATATEADGIYIASATLPASPWAMVVTLPEASVLHRPRAFLQRMLLVGLLLVGFGALAAWLLGRHVTRPLRTMIDAADALAAGEYERRVTIRRHDEIGRLAEAFDGMAARIGSSVHRTTRLQSVTAALSGALDVRAVAGVMMESGLPALRAHAGSIYLFRPGSPDLELLRAEGYTREQLAKATRIPVHAPLPLAEAARTGEPVWVESIEEWQKRYPSYGTLLPRSLAWAAMPLVARGRRLGVMGFSFHEARPFDDDTRGFLIALADQCAQAMDRALLFDAALLARREAEEAGEAAQTANEAKSSFLAMMSHELRTPLNAIGGYVELLEMGLRGPVTDAQLQDLARIRRNQDHLLSVIGDILSLSRIEAGQLPLHLADVPLATVLHDVEALIAPQVAGKGLRLHVRACDPSVVVRVDAEKAQQALLNLLSNAVRFTDHGGVTVSCEVAEREVAVLVSDTGVGIPSEMHEAIFEPFVQVDGGLTRRRGGTGLGLAISRELVTAMGGRVAVQSVPGRGSVFTLVLPRALGAAAAPGAAAAARQASAPDE